MILVAHDPLAAAPLAAAPTPLTAAGIIVNRYANAGYLSRDTDTPANHLYAARVLGDPVISVSVIDAIGVAGRAVQHVGEIILSNHDRALDNVVRFGRTVGQRIVVRAADVADRRASDYGVPLAAAPAALVGRVTRISGWSHLVRVEIGDLLSAIDGQLQSIKYSGAGGMDGPATLAGRPQPIALGECHNVTPVFLGNVDLGAGVLPTYQTHWRAIDAHTAVRERGVTMSRVTGTPTTGQWRDWPERGAFQLGFSPAGTITCDVRGDNVPFLALTTTEVVQRLLTSLSPRLSATDFDTRSLDAASVALPGQIGWYAAADETTVGRALGQICAAAGAYLWTTRAGRIGLAALAPPAAHPDIEIDFHDQVEAEATLPPAAFVPLPTLIEVEHSRNWTVLTDIAGAVPAGERARLQSAGAVATAVSGPAALLTGRAHTLRLPGLYVHAADAAARAGALRDIVSRVPLRLRVVTDRYRHQVELGLTARVARADVAGGWWSGVVVGWREWLAAQRVELDLWG